MGISVATQSTIHVAATTFEGTASALRVAVPLARGAAARLVVLVPRIVPYPLDLDAAAPTFLERRYKELVTELGGHATIDVCVCRRADDLAAKLMTSQSTVVVGGRVGRWLTSPEERFANRLGRHARSMIFAACGRYTRPRRIASSTAAAILISVAILGGRAATLAAQQPPAAPDQQPAWQYGASADIGALVDSNSPGSHLFRNRGTTPRVDELDVNMATAFLRRPPTEQSRFGVELSAQAGEDSRVFGFSATAPNIGGADFLLHLGPTSASYLAPVGKGLTVQGGIFSSLIGYDSLYAKDNFLYTRPWGADYTPYLMLGVNASYPVTDKLTATAAVVSGYWHLANANNVPSLIGQASYKLTDEITVKQTALYGPHQENTAIGLWRVLSDTIVERKTNRLTTAFEYQFSAERVDAPNGPEALWTSAQLPVHWTIAGPVSATLRPEIAWDSDGRWTGFPQRVIALTAGGEYRAKLGTGGQAILRAEYRVDDSRGSGGGFFAGADNHLTPTQNLFVVALLVTFDGTIHR